MIKNFSIVFIFLLFACVVFSGDGQSSKTIEITNENLDLLSTGNWLVKFGAPWSGHCKKLKPVIEKVAKHYNHDLENSKVKVAEVDCDENGSICKKYDIRGYPTILFLGEGKTKHYQGQIDFDTIKEATNKYFKEKEFHSIPYFGYTLTYSLIFSSSSPKTITTAWIFKNG
ncbi:hypothetical protein ACTFIU_000133 [Dictyostelium citrinum]